jgi:endonuclease YncB( thermonuclease family)
MQFLLAVCLTAVAATSLTSPAIRDPNSVIRDVKRSDPVLVRTVIDGDTIDVTTYGRVRLLGVDAPEVGRGFDTSAPFGKEARDRLTALVLHRWVRLEQEGPATDVYNRHLAYVVTEDGICINVVLVREGLARISARLPLSRLVELRRAEAEAQGLHRGMWGSASEMPTTGYTRRSEKTTPAAKPVKAKAPKAAPKTKPATPKASPVKNTSAKPSKKPKGE